MSPRAWLLLAVCSALWGIPYLLIKVGVDAGASPALVAFGRTAVGALVLLPIALARGSLRGIGPRWRALAALGALDFTVPFLLLGFAEREVSSSLAGILIATVPMLIALLAIRLDPDERVGGVRLAGLVVGFGGVCLLLGVEVSGSVAALVGAGLVLLASLSYALATLWFKRAFGGSDPLGVVTASLGAAALLAAPAALVDPGSAPGSGASLASIAALGVLCSAAAYAVYYALVLRVGALRAAINTYISPAIAVALGVTLLGEPLGAGAVAGLLVILAGSWLAAGGGPPGGARAPAASPAGIPAPSRPAPAARRLDAARPDAASA